MTSYLQAIKSAVAALPGAEGDALALARAAAAEALHACFLEISATDTSPDDRKARATSAGTRNTPRAECPAAVRHARLLTWRSAPTRRRSRARSSRRSSRASSIAPF